jgi:hypothetical protein
MTLPSEIRNQIWEDLLLAKDRSILIDHTFHPPALHSTSRQIRAETYQMLYEQNRLTIIVIDYDARICLKFLRLLRPCKTSPGKQLQYSLELRGRSVWANLMCWCWLEQQSKIQWGLRTNGSRSHAVSDGALAVATSHIGGSWDRCRDALASLRTAFGLLDQAWLEGEDGFDRCR